MTGETETAVAVRPAWAKLARWPIAAWNAGLKLRPAGLKLRPVALRQEPGSGDSGARAGSATPWSATPWSATLWSATLAKAIQELEQLNQTTERDFLAIGGKLGKFIEEIGSISSQLNALVDLITGGDGLGTSQALAQALDCFVEMQARYSERNNGLGGMRRQAARFRETLAGFQETVATFQIIGVLTRIETERLGSAGLDFGSLAGDVKSLAGQVQAKVETALEIGTLLIPPIESAIRNISVLEAQQMKDLSGAFESLSSFRDIQNKARDSSVVSPPVSN
jgi:hypothetical protein